MSRMSILAVTQSKSHAAPITHQSQDHLNMLPQHHMALHYSPSKSLGVIVPFFLGVTQAVYSLHLTPRHQVLYPPFIGM